ncbi:hypothetical protein HK100_006658 [Physocladia obscura]|uniref:Isopentenyl phosphate kinase n=1 Tax=Physocladia obscura TaxID=109957 RepID=A0AAD5TFD3_9FUNG|nr:hypothetical protein HK100_006658 [Physocladia obscura]
MYLLCQVYAANLSLPRGTPNAFLDRILYVFGCNKASCSKLSGSFAVIRAIKAPHLKQPVAPSTQQFPTPLKKSTSNISTNVITNLNVTVKIGNSSNTSKKTPQQPQKQRKPSIYTTAASFGDTLIGNQFNGVSVDGDIFGSFSDDFPSFGTSEKSIKNSNSNDEILKLLDARDKKYASWMDDLNENDDSDDNTGQTQVQNDSKNSEKSENGGNQSNTKSIAAKKKQDTNKQKKIIREEKENTIADLSELEDGVDQLQISPADISLNPDAPSFPGYALEFVDDSTQANIIGNLAADNLSHEMKLLQEYQKSESIDIRTIIERAAGIPSGYSRKGSTKQQDDDGKSQVTGWEGEVYEKTQIRSITKSFKKFQKTVAKNPEQCLRYGFNESPLNYNDNPFLDPPPCPHCNGARTFEMQLMPALLTFLPVEEHAEAVAAKTSSMLSKKESGSTATTTVPSLANVSTKGVDFGTVLVYSCSKNCVPPSGGDVRYSDEIVVVQHEECMRVVIKFGGAAITEKSTNTHQIKKQTIRKSIGQIVAAMKDCKRSETALEVIIVCGVGPFGHSNVTRYGIARGIKTAVQKAGPAILSANAGLELEFVPAHQIVCTEECGLRTAWFDSARINAVLAAGCIPVTTGCMVPDKDPAWGYSVFSGDAIVAQIVTTLNPDLILMGTDVAGIYSGDPKLDQDVELIPLINFDNLDCVLRESVSGSTVVDVTGGMQGKLEKLAGSVGSCPTIVFKLDQESCLYDGIVFGEIAGSTQLSF